MNKNILLFNIGNSDVDLDGDKANKQSEPRIIGKKIIDNWNEYASRIEIPIIKTIIQALINKFEKIDEVYLFCSDQDEEVDEKYRNKDTLYFAEIVKKKLIEMEFNESNIKIKTIRSNIASYDEMYKYFKEFFNKNIESFKNNYIFCSITGGTPAANTTLLINCLEYFGSDFKAIYVTENSDVKLLDVSTYYIQDNILKIFNKEIKNHHYQGAKSIVEEFRGLIPEFNNITYLLDSAIAILNLNFENCYQNLNKLYKLKLDFAIKQKIEKLIDKIKELKTTQELIESYNNNESKNNENNDTNVIDNKLSNDDIIKLENAYKQLLGFLVERIKISHQSKNEFEVLDLLFGFIENIFKYLAMKKIKLPIFKKYFKDIKEELKKDDNFVEQCKKNKINLEGEINTHVLKEYLEYNVSNFSDDEKNVITFCKKLFNLKELRNKAIHNFGKADLEEFNAKIKKEDKFIQNKIQSIEDILERIIQLLGINQTNILPEMQNIIGSIFKR